MSSGALDSGCGRSIVGKETLDEFYSFGRLTESNHFRYGNETARQAIKMPVCLAGLKRAIHAAVVQGRAPVSVSRKAMKALKAKIDFRSSELTIFKDQ